MLGPLSMRGGGGAAVDGRRRGVAERDLRAVWAATRFYLEQLARAGDGSRRCARPPDGDRGGIALGGRGDRGAGRGARAAARAAAIVGEPFEPDLAGEIAGLDQADEPLALDVCSRRTSSGPTELPRRFAFRHPLVPRRSTREPRRAGGWPLTTAPRRRWRRAGRGRRSRHHVEQPPVRATRRRSRCCIAAGGGERRPARRRRGALVRGGAAADPGSRPRSPITVRGRSPGHCAPRAGSSRQGGLIEAIDLIDDPADRRRIELTTAARRSSAGSGAARTPGGDWMRPSQHYRRARRRTRRAAGRARDGRRLRPRLRVSDRGRDGRRLPAPAALGSGPPLAAAASALCLARRRRDGSSRRASTAAEALAMIDSLRRRAALEQLDSLYHLAGPRTTSSSTTRRSPTSTE